jgi:hypothetical protein
MNYYVFSAPTNQYATVHKGACPHCKNGKGQRRPLGPKANLATEWLGPYSTSEEAFATARASGLKNVTGCGHCKPENPNQAASGSTDSFGSSCAK